MAILEHCKMVFLAIGCTIACIPQIQAGLLLYPKHSALKQSSDHLVTTHVTVTQDVNTKGSQLKIFLGTSPTNPCSDLQLKHVMTSQEDNVIPAGEDTDYMDSEDFAFFATGLSCFRMDLVIPSLVGEKTYSIGPFQLTWDADSNRYVAANPNKIFLHLP